MTHLCNFREQVLVSVVLMQVLLEAAFLTLRFSCYAYRIFRILFSVIFLSMLVMLLSTLNMMGCCGMSQLSHSSLVVETLWYGLGSVFLNFYTGKSRLISFDFPNNKGGYILDGKSSFKYQVSLSLLVWIEALSSSQLLKLSVRKLELDCFRKVLFH